MKYITFLRKFLHYTNLESEVDDLETIHQTIEKDVAFKGTNLWILIFAILIASVGLNMNSTAVIIGAMLISPLMGPITGIGYSIATYDFRLFRKAVKNFTFAVIAGLFASTAYFFISPISTAHSELLARTSPSIYDVLIAFFGGLAGIVAISSRQKGNVIPGVAIATALMPPLCTAGYGLANLRPDYFFGAIYLFTINAVFIALAALILSRILNFPFRDLVDAIRKKRVNRWITVITALVIIPSIYFGYKLVVRERFSENTKKFIETIGSIDGNYLLKTDINPDTKTIILVYGGTSLSEDQKAGIRARAGEFNLDTSGIHFQQGLSFDEIDRKNNELTNLKIELSRLSREKKAQEELADSLLRRNSMGKALLAEISKIFPEITECSFADTYAYGDNKDHPDSTILVAFTLKNKTLKPKEKNKIEQWLKARLHSDRVKIYYDFP